MFWPALFMRKAPARLPVMMLRTQTGLLCRRQYKRSRNQGAPNAARQRGVQWPKSNLRLWPKVPFAAILLCKVNASVPIPDRGAAVLKMRFACGRCRACCGRRQRSLIAPRRARCALGSMTGCCLRAALRAAVPHPFAWWRIMRVVHATIGQAHGCLNMPVGGRLILPALACATGRKSPF